MLRCWNGNLMIKGDQKQIMISDMFHRVVKSAEFLVLNNFRPGPQRVLINSIPKAGTHLMSSMLNQLPNLSISLDLTGLDKFTSEEDRLKQAIIF